MPCSRVGVRVLHYTYESIRASRFSGLHYNDKNMTTTTVVHIITRTMTYIYTSMCVVMQTDSSAAVSGTRNGSFDTIYLMLIRCARGGVTNCSCKSRSWLLPKPQPPGTLAVHINRITLAYDGAHGLIACLCGPIFCPYTVYRRNSETGLKASPLLIKSAFCSSLFFGATLRTEYLLVQYEWQTVV